jgi:mercuric ion binding protein
MMKTLISKVLLISLLAIMFIGANASATTNQSQYVIRADGLACAYCAYGIEKKLMKITGVEYVDIDLKKGRVLVQGTENLELTAPHLKTLFNDAGFTFRTLEKLAHK